MNNHSQIVDSFGRVHDYLRISLTDRCNLRCTYCMPKEGIPLRDKAEFMTSEEVIEIAQKFVSLGVKKIRLTGGEPLIKKDIVNVILQLGKLPIELTLTTNGVVVDRFIDTFKEAGIKSINVSLDTLKSERNKGITRRDYFDRVINNIQLLLDNDFDVKINAVLMKGENDDEILDFVDLTKDKPLAIRFIEFMPFDGNNWDRAKTVSLEEIEQVVFGKNKTVKRLIDSENSTSKNFQIDGYKGTFGVISTVTNPFCDSCNRIRLTADGKIKNCLFSANELDLLTALRKGEDIEPLIRQSIASKKEKLAGLGSFDSLDSKEVYSKNRTMTAIGG